MSRFIGEDFISYNYTQWGNGGIYGYLHLGGFREELLVNTNS